jgi:GGDEF domain-containing protein
MRLNNLNKYRSLRALFEEEESNLPPLELSRYPKVSRHKLAQFAHAIDVEGEIEDLKSMAYAYPPPWYGKEDFRGGGDVDPPDYKTAIVSYRRCQAAFRKLMQLLQMNAVSGLRGANDYYHLANKANVAAKEGSTFGGKDKYIVIASDVDDMKYLNDKTGLGHRGVNSILKYIGELFTQSFSIENTKLFHPHGDEFRVISYIGPTDNNKEGLDENQVKTRFIHLLQGCIEVANKLASTGFYQEGWESSRRIQPTISFGISTTDTAADGVLTHVKTGASSGKKMKYAITIDRDLRHALGFNPEELNHWVNTIKKTQGDVHVGVIKPPEVAVYDGPEQESKLLPFRNENKDVIGIAVIIEDKMPIEDLQKRRGAVVLEASWEEIPESVKQKLEILRKQKRAYLDMPEGVMKIGPGIYIPLKEPFKL